MGKGVLPQRAEKVSAELLGAEHRVLEGRQAGRQVLQNGRKGFPRVSPGVNRTAIA